MLGINVEELIASIKEIQDELDKLTEKLSVPSNELTFEEAHEHLKAIREKIIEARDLLNRALSN